MNTHDNGWQRLVAAARQVSDDRDTAAPYGFSTRIAALALQSERKPGLFSVFDRFSWRALGVAGLLAAASAASSYGFVDAQTDDDGSYLDDTAEMLVLGLSGS